MRGRSIEFIRPRIFRIYAMHIHTHTHQRRTLSDIASYDVKAIHYARITRESFRSYLDFAPANSPAGVTQRILLFAPRTRTIRVVLSIRVLLAVIQLAFAPPRMPAVLRIPLGSIKSCRARRKYTRIKVAALSPRAFELTAKQ